MHFIVVKFHVVSRYSQKNFPVRVVDIFGNIAANKGRTSFLIKKAFARVIQANVIGSFKFCLISIYKNLLRKQISVIGYEALLLNPFDKQDKK